MVKIIAIYHVIPQVSFLYELYVGDALDTWDAHQSSSMQIFERQEMYDNCPFKNGNGYGDGRALSIGEVVIEGVRVVG